MEVMTIEQVEQTLIDAGFIVRLSGMSFVVSLSNRSVNTMDVLAALNYVSNVSCVRSSGSVVVFVD
jgi:hypothetical protein